jgi:hypothetical protein
VERKPAFTEGVCIGLADGPPRVDPVPNMAIHTPNGPSGPRGAMAR